MQPLTLPGDPTRPLRILCVGAHADDIEIGCGGTLLALRASGRPFTCTWVVFSGSAARAREAREGARLFLGHEAGHTVRLEGFRDGYFPTEFPAIKDLFETLKPVEPDLVFTHYREDRHQDHRVLSDLAWNTFRDHTIFEYEIPKYDGDLGMPNVFVPLTHALGEQKVAHLGTAFGSQRDKRWFTDETFWALLRLRGIECAAPGGYAEAFYGRKTVVSP